jgi:hypothetical protein
MKKQFLLFAGLLLMLAAAVSSCSIQKRHYRPGFYHDRAKKADVVVNTVDEVPRETLEEELSCVHEETVAPAKDSAVAISAQVERKKPVVEKIYRTFSEAEQQMTNVPAYSKVKDRLPVQATQDDKEKMDFVGISFGFGIFALAGLIGLLLALSGVPGQVSFGGFLLMLASPILALLAVIFGLFGLFDSFATGDGTDKRNAALVFLLALVDLVLLMFILMRFY